MNILAFVTNPQDYPTVSLENNQVLFHENDTCNEIGIVLKGSITIISYDLMGNEILFNTINKDGIFGNNLVFSSDPHYKGNVIARGHTEVCLIGKQQLLSLLQNNRKFLISYLQLQSDTGKNLNSRIRLLSISDVRERVLYYLQENNGTIQFTSITQLARDLNLSREAVSRTVHALSREKIITLDGNTMTLSGQYE